MYMIELIQYHVLDSVYQTGGSQGGDRSNQTAQERIECNVYIQELEKIYFLARRSEQE